jgi:hypothetical protein
LTIVEGMTITSAFDILQEKDYFQISPNPVFKNFFYLSNSLEEKSSLKLQLLTASGQVIFNRKIEMWQEKSLINLPLNLAEGVYFLKIITDNLSEQKSIIKFN